MKNLLCFSSWYALYILEYCKILCVVYIHPETLLNTPSAMLPVVIRGFMFFNIRPSLPGNPPRRDQFPACVQEALQHGLSVMIHSHLDASSTASEALLACLLPRWCQGKCRPCTKISLQSPSLPFLWACTVLATPVCGIPPQVLCTSPSCACWPPPSVPPRAPWAPEKPLALFFQTLARCQVWSGWSPWCSWGI